MAAVNIGGAAARLRSKARECLSPGVRWTRSGILNEISMTGASADAAQVVRDETVQTLDVVMKKAGQIDISFNAVTTLSSGGYAGSLSARLAVSGRFPQL
jgi:hypothetical protein